MERARRNRGTARFAADRWSCATAATGSVDCRAYYATPRQWQFDIRRLALKAWTIMDDFDAAAPAPVASRAGAAGPGIKRVPLT